MILNSSMLRKIAPLSLALLMAACTDKTSGTDSDSQGSGTDGSSTTMVAPTTGGSTDADATAGTTAGGATEGMSGTTVEPETTTESSPTTGGGDPALMTSCMAACEHIFECVDALPGTVEDCMGGCLDAWGGPECGDAGLDFLQCLVGMNCKQLSDYVENDKAGVCAGEAEAADAVCGGSSICTMGSGAGAGECSVSRECDGTVEEFVCNGEICTCVFDGEFGESCKDEGVCPMDLDAQIAAGEACCGWDWS